MWGPKDTEMGPSFTIFQLYRRKQRVQHLQKGRPLLVQEVPVNE